MPYPQPNYFGATLPVATEIATDQLATLQNLAKGAVMNGLADPDAIKYMLGLSIRMGLFFLNNPATTGTALIDRFDARFTGATTAATALLFPADVTLANTVATNTSRTLAKVYRTAGFVYLAMYENDTRNFFVPPL